jgi:hypothetical protein
MTVAYQMAVSDVTFEDERYVVCHSPQFQLELS